jgi:hypothetical protein
MLLTLPHTDNNRHYYRYGAAAPDCVTDGIARPAHDAAIERNRLNNVERLGAYVLRNLREPLALTRDKAL